MAEKGLTFEVREHRMSRACKAAGQRPGCRGPWLPCVTHICLELHSCLEEKQRPVPVIQVQAWLTPRPCGTFPVSGCPSAPAAPPCPGAQGLPPGRELRVSLPRLVLLEDRFIEHLLCARQGAMDVEETGQV